jgi:hypothetical protein
MGQRMRRNPDSKPQPQTTGKCPYQSVPPHRLPRGLTKQLAASMRSSSSMRRGTRLHLELDGPPLAKRQGSAQPRNQRDRKGRNPAARALVAIEWLRNLRQEKSSNPLDLEPLHERTGR